ncbi:hypothetical protein BDK51DRAFT_45049 [Blyttiomyces helicus]|uniref:Uncharacterized protein n=1 Tax=Blyttiomyces helicus TaxID=388810 RepID=A0A4P9W394_9FUNG|nr:hypothetical protein BDK51DRAFT_45049 [Blyttiomyces helicus]|eukprot:RKO85110.1 hypothetical protein BDK51DRAFT_45049 [Blyttiomyces helicus]
MVLLLECSFDKDASFFAGDTFSCTLTFSNVAGNATQPPAEPVVPARQRRPSIPTLDRRESVSFFSDTTSADNTPRTSVADGRSSLQNRPWEVSARSSVAVPKPTDPVPTPPDPASDPVDPHPIPTPAPLPNGSSVPVPAPPPPAPETLPPAPASPPRPRPTLPTLRIPSTDDTVPAPTEPRSATTHPTSGSPEQMSLTQLLRKSISLSSLKSIFRSSEDIAAPASHVRMRVTDTADSAAPRTLRSSRASTLLPALHTPRLSPPTSPGLLSPIPATDPPDKLRARESRREEISWAYAQMTGTFSVDPACVRLAAFEPLKSKVMYKAGGGGAGGGGGGSLGVPPAGPASVDSGNVEKVRVTGMGGGEMPRGLFCVQSSPDSLHTLPPKKQPFLDRQQKPPPLYHPPIDPILRRHLITRRE